MLVSLNWLMEFTDIDRSPEELAELLTMGGIEIEGITRVGEDLADVFTAEIREITPHPSTPNLNLARINLGDKDLVVVCAAPNIRVGQVVPYAGPGVTLPSGTEITEREIKGVRSPGMLCSEKELKLGEDASGILEFDPSTPIGLPLPKAMPFITDVILETSVTPNRGDCLSILGIAREVAALAGLSWRKPDLPRPTGTTNVSDKCRVDVPDYDLCPRYVVTMIESVRIGRSPFHVRLRLTRSGVRPISNVVDATNLAMLECGQPIHAFDYSLLEEGRIVVRRCDPGETFVTLDGTERKLPENALMIRDGKKSVAVAGVMGGLNSEINDDTSTVLIESACFERFSVRRTAKALGMGTEASFRFERGVDPEGTLWAAHRVAALVAELAGGNVLAGDIDVYPVPIPRPPVRVRPDKVRTLLGVFVTADEITSYLGRLGIACEYTGDADKSIIAVPPSWRWDLEREVDMAEETARIHGFQNVPVTMPSYVSAPDRTQDRHRKLGRIRQLMNASGFTEIITMSFVSADASREFVSADPAGLPLMNPLTEDYMVMRTSLIPGLLTALKRNVNFRCEDLRLYELGRTFTLLTGQELPQEDLRLAGLLAGARYPRLWNLPHDEFVDFYDAKGALENLLEGLGIPEATFAPAEVSFLHPGKSAYILLEDEVIGFVGEPAPHKMREHDLTGNVYIFEILVEPLLIRSCKKAVFRPIPRYPYIERDLSFIIEEKCSGEKIKRLISRLRHDIIGSVILFDIYRGESIPKGHKSMAFRIRYQSEDRTLTDEEVQTVHAQVVQALVQELGAAMRE